MGTVRMDAARKALFVPECRGLTAGIWDRWRDLETCSILTTTPNAVTGAVHDRMPVIVAPDAYDLWLDPGLRDPRIVSDVLKPYDGALMRCHPVSTRVNHAGNDDEGC